MSNSLPIIFSGPMVRALLDDTKTQTRRIAKVNSDNLKPGMVTTNAGYVPRSVREHLSYCPYGKPGDTLWVRETCVADERQSDLTEGVRYLADDAFIPIANTDEAAALWINLSHYRADEAGVPTGKPVPSIHMPRWASRITLTLTDVRLERLNDIKSADAAAEGWPGADEKHINPVDWYAELWDHINGKRVPWDLNPWVWALRFTCAKASGKEAKQ
jgi:hypothetical protein